MTMDIKPIKTERDYRRVLEATRRAMEEGRSVDEAVMSSAHG